MNRFLWASYGMYFMGGVTSVFFGAIMPELLAHYHVSYTSGGLLILLQSVGFIIGVPLAATLMNRLSYRWILSGSALAVTIAQIGILSLPSYVWVHLLVILNGIGMSALETAVASYIMELFPRNRAAFMSRLEVAFGLGALCMPMVCSIFIAADHWRFSSLPTAMFGMILAVFWMTVSTSLEPSVSSGSVEERSAPPPPFRGRLSRYGVLSLFLLMILVYVGVEGSINGFLPSIFKTYLHARPSISSLSTSVFWIAMVLGRLAIGWIVRRMSYELYLFVSIAVGILFLFLLEESHFLFLSYVAVFGFGLAMSAVYSVTMVYANHTFPRMERLVTSAVTGFADIGGAMLPAVTGYAMDHLLPQQVLWLILAFVAALLVFFLLIQACLRLVRQRYVPQESR